MEESLLLTLTIAFASLHLSMPGYVEELCWPNGQTNTISCQPDEIIRMHTTILSAIPTADGVPLACENLDRYKFCRAPTNRSDVEFVARQKASYSVQAEDLSANPEKGGECLPGMRSNMAQVYYECIKTKGSILQSICSDVLWENEVSGYLVSPYFPYSYPSGQNIDLDCYCELRPQDGSRVELVGVLMNPSTTGRTWSLQAEAGPGTTQDLASQFYVSRRLTRISTTSTVKLRFRTQGIGQQQPTRVGPPPGFWLEYKAFRGDTEPWSASGLASEGRATLYCNDPYIEQKRLAGMIGGSLGGVILIVVTVVVCCCCIRKKRREKKEREFYADRAPVSSRKPQLNDVHKNRAYQDDHLPYQENQYHARGSDYDYPEKEPQYGRRSRANSTNSYNDKVFLDEVDRKSTQSSGRTWDNDSIAKKSLSGSTQSDNYSEVNYSPKGPRHSSLGRDTAV